MNDDINTENEPLDLSLRRVTCVDGVRTTTSANHFEIAVDAKTEIWEQAVVQKLREWCRWRKAQEQLQESGNVPR